jgi:hypothetical protein
MRIEPSGRVYSETMERSTMLAIEAGEFDLVSPDCREITGRPARSMREFLESVRDAAAPHPGRSTP